jgi:beta-glucosidase
VPGARGGFGDLQTRGEPIDLTFPADQLQALRAAMRAKPTIVALYLDRPYVIPEIAREAAALVGHFGVSDAALLDVVTGAAVPSGKLPFEMPSSMDAVRSQKEDVPYDSVAPLFRFGHGLTYRTRGRR